MDLTQHVSLCKECRIRQGFVDKKDLEQADQCYICNNLMNKLETINNALIRKMNEGYEFGTFQSESRFLPLTLKEKTISGQD